MCGIFAVYTVDSTASSFLSHNKSFCFAVIILYDADGVACARVTGGQHSSRLLSMRFAEALLELPGATEQLTAIAEGSLVDALLVPGGL